MEKSMLHILLVEDSRADVLLLTKKFASLQTEGLEITNAATLQEALRLVSEHDFDVTLLDLSLPDSIELEGLDALRNLAPKLPIIILTGNRDETLLMSAIEGGAHDYLKKDTATAEGLLRAIRFAARRKKFEGNLIRQANYDRLTGLINRSLFENRLEAAIARHKRQKSGLCVMFLDLNRFKNVNDTMGHAAGDKLLAQVAQRLPHSLRNYDSVARFGGDEFAVLLEGVENSRDAAVLAQKIIQSLEKPFTVDNQPVSIGVSIGISLNLPDNPLESEPMLAQADEAMYRAKLSNKSDYCFYRDDVLSQSSHRLKMESDLASVFSRDELCLYYQPKINLYSHAVLGAEALLRWNHPASGLLPPAEFLPIAEQLNLMPRLGQWVLYQACQDLEKWQKDGLFLVRLSLNLSASQIDDPNFITCLTKLSLIHPIAVSHLVFEIPAEAFSNAGELRLKCLKQMVELGFALHLDHFGAHPICLSTLQRMPLEAVKLDQSLVERVDESSEARELVTATTQLARFFDLAIIANGVERGTQQKLLIQSCDQAQGYAISRPMKAQEMIQWLAPIGSLT